MKKYLLKLIVLVLVCVFSTGCNDAPGRSASENMSEPTLQPEEQKPEIERIDGTLRGSLILDSSSEMLPYDRISAVLFAKEDNILFLQNQEDTAYYVLVNSKGAEVLGSRERFFMGTTATMVGNTMIFMDVIGSPLGGGDFARETFVDIENRTVESRAVISQRLRVYHALNENEYIMRTMEGDETTERATYVIKGLDGTERPFLKSSVTLFEDFSTDGMALTEECVYQNHVYIVALNGENYSINEYNLEGELLNVYPSDALGDFLKMTFPGETKVYKYRPYSLSRFGDYFIVQNDSLNGKVFKLENEQLIPLAIDIDQFRPAFGGKSIYDDSKLDYFYFFARNNENFKNKVFGLDHGGNWKCWEVESPTEDTVIIGVWMDTENNLIICFTDLKKGNDFYYYFPKELFA